MLSLTSWLVISSALTSSLVSASSKTPASIVGAAYIITNEPNGNYILSHAISSNGTIDYAGSTYAGGVGFEEFTAADGSFVALFSQSAIQVFENFLFTVNAGSNTVSMFEIDSQNPSKLTMVGKPVNSGGDFPISVAVSPQTGNLCVLNGGLKNGVQCFTIDPVHGLRRLPNTNRAINFTQTNPPLGPGHTASQVIFSENSSRLIAAVKGDNNTGDPGFLVAWDVARDGSLSRNFVKTPSVGGTEAFGMSLIPGTDAIISSDPATGFFIYDFSKGDKATVIPGRLEGQIDSCWTVFSKKTGTFFIADRLASIIFEVKIDKDLQATTVGKYQQTANSSLLDLAIASANGNDFLYQLAAGYTSIDVLNLQAPGKAQLIQTYNSGAAATADGLTIQGGSLAGMATYVIPSCAT